MDLKKRLFRRPVTTAIWLVVLVAMSLLLNTGAALMYSSSSLSDIIGMYHIDIAVRTDRDKKNADGYTEFGEDGAVIYEDRTLFREDVDFLQRLDAVQNVYFHTLTAGYSRDFVPAISPDSDFEINEPYRDVMIVGEVLSTEEPIVYGQMDLSALGKGEEEPGAYVHCQIRVEQFVLANEEYTGGAQPETDQIVDVKWTDIFGQDGFDYLQPGQRYVFFGAYKGEEGQQNASLQLIGRRCTVRNGQLISFVYEMKNTSAVRYGTPVAAKIEGTLDAFLDDPENAHWVELMESWEAWQHSLPVLGTEAVHSMHAFVNRDAVMVEGRFFTAGEYENGEKVCIISQNLASQSGIQVGDTISLSQFLCGNTELQPARNTSIIDSLRGRLHDPSIGVMPADLEYTTENEAFTVVGLYRLRSPWDGDSYSFSPNTVFIPQKAQIDGGFGGMSTGSEEAGNYPAPGEEEYGTGYGVFFTVELKSGMADSFVQALAGSRLDGQFITVEQSNGKVRDGVDSIVASMRKLMTGAGVGWALILVLYILLYQRSQRNNIGIMRSLGASPRKVRAYLVGSGSALAAVGVVLGSALSAAIMQTVQSRVFDTAFSEIEITKYSNAELTRDTLEAMVAQSQVPLEILLLMAAAQLAVFCVLLWIQAFLVSRTSPRKLLGK